MRSRAGQVLELGRIVFVEALVEPLRDGDLLVRSRFASICGSDLHVFNRPGAVGPRLPGARGRRRGRRVAGAGLRGR